MNTKIDIKSAVIGLALGVAVTVSVAAATAPVIRTGRYQIVSKANNGGQGGRHGLVIDTVTGKVWLAYLPSTGRSDDEFFQPKTTDK